MRLIDADKLENILSGWEEEYKAGIIQDGRTKDLFSDGILSAMFTVFRQIKKAQTVDAVPVAHAYWKNIGGGHCECSNCGMIAGADYPASPSVHYCAKCGAKMDEKTEEKK